MVLLNRGRLFTEKIAGNLEGACSVTDTGPPDRGYKLWYLWSFQSSTSLPTAPRDRPTPLPRKLVYSPNVSETNIVFFLLWFIPMYLYTLYVHLLIDAWAGMLSATNTVIESSLDLRLLIIVFGTATPLMH